MSEPPLLAMDRSIELDRFMGDWYVLAHIPIDLPFASEASAHNAIESYHLNDDGFIDTTYRFRDGSFDGPLEVMTPRAWVPDPSTNAEWRMQFLWPFRSAYLIVFVDDLYETTIVGVPSRSNVWVMARTPAVGEATYSALKAQVAHLGYDMTKFRRVPQKWPETTPR